MVDESTYSAAYKLIWISKISKDQMKFQRKDKRKNNIVEEKRKKYGNSKVTKLIMQRKLNYNWYR